MQLSRCAEEAAQWFLTRGYVVVFALRPGYGSTGGEWAEGYGECSNPQFERGGLSTARDIDAIVNYATALPFVRADGVVVVGHSAGGWGTIAYDSRPHPKVAALINFSGGRGGHRDNIPHSNCREDVLVQERYYSHVVALRAERQLLLAASRQRAVASILRGGR